MLEILKLILREISKTFVARITCRGINDLDPILLIVRTKSLYSRQNRSQKEQTTPEYVAFQQ